MEYTGSSTVVREEERDALDNRLLAQSDPLDSPLRTTAGIAARRSRALLNEGRVVFALAVGLYLIVAVLLDFKYHTFSGDAFSRMANGFYILYSRDPHLAAVGFVWEPLQSIADMVLLLGNPLWPALSHNNFAGSLVSSFAMAGAVYQVLAALREWGVSRTPRLVLAALFALNPIIVFYGGNGMSEGLYLFTLIACVRYLLRWIHDGDIRSLAYAGVALAFSYLTRNEAFGGLLLGAAAVGAVSYWRTKKTRSSRFKTATSDVVIFGAPPVVAAAGWAITSYVITGHFFEQFASVYGNSEQEAFLPHKSLNGRILYEVHAIGSLALLLPVLLIASVVVIVKIRDLRVLAPLAVLGGALGFDMLAYLDKTIESYFRYFIVAVPLEVLLLGGILAALQSSGPVSEGTLVNPRPPGRGVRNLATIASVVLVLVVMVPATALTATAMFNPGIGGEETQQLAFIFHAHPNPAELAWKDRYPQELALGSYFSAMHLPDGDILTDNSTGCVPEMITTMNQPKVFVIPNDRDFQRILADPLTFHVHYILEPNPAGTPITAMNFQYPSLWRTGSRFAKVVHQFAARGTCPEFRLFQVVHHSNQGV